MTFIESEPARLLEVRKYYQRPPNDDIPDTRQPTRSHVGSKRVAIPDTALTAFLQLIIWRLSMRRAIISFVDRSLAWD